MKYPFPATIRPAQTTQGGVVLLEALIALLVFAFGILGLVSLQAASLKNITESQYRVEAAMWADTLVAQMRIADPTTRSADFVTGGGTSTTGYTAWKNLVTSSTVGLPGASTTLPTVTIVNNAVTITINWRALTDTATRRYVTIAQLD